MREGDHLRTNRIQVDISDQSQEILIPIAEKGLVPSLKEMAYFAVLPIEVAGIGEIQKLHDLRQRRFRCLDEQVEVIGHQDVGVEDKTALLLIMPESAEILASVLIVKENVLLLIAPGYHMVERSGKLYARRSCHGKILPSQIPFFKPDPVYRPTANNSTNI